MLRTLTILISLSLLLGGVANATIIESGDLNIVSDVGNPSDGLRFLDMTYSDGLTLAAALANAQATYANARLATPDEWDDLFSAAGVVYSSASTASDAFATGSSAVVIANPQASAVALNALLGPTIGATLNFFSDPDGTTATSSTRDFLRIAGDGTTRIFQGGFSVPAVHDQLGWLLVSEVPEPSTFSMLVLGVFALGLRRWRAPAR